MARDLTLEARQGGVWRTVRIVRDNENRLIVVHLGETMDGLRLRIDRSWGEEAIRLFAFTVPGQNGRIEG